jgi:hypothetical protein
VAEIADVEGLAPTFVANVISPNAVRVGNTNEIGNIWGLEEEPMISTQSPPLPPVPPYHISNSSFL